MEITRYRRSGRFVVELATFAAHITRIEHSRNADQSRYRGTATASVGDIKTARKPLWKLPWISLG